jgi:hypothetical protein
MGEPDDREQFVLLQADDLEIYVSRDIWDSMKPKQSRLLVGVAGYGRFWLYLKPPSGMPREREQHAH